MHCLHLTRLAAGRAARTLAVLTLVLLGIAGASDHASAQPTTAQAEHLFREGKRLMAEGKLAEACEAFQASFNKDAAVTTLLNLADCREKNQQYASAWSHFLEAARMTRDKPDQAAINKTANDRAAAAEARLSYLTINVPEDAHVENLTITLNGETVERAEWNRSVPVDGGEYTVAGKAPAHEPWGTTVTVGPSKDRQAVTVPRFHPVSAAVRGRGEDDDTGGEAPSRWTTKRKLALGVGAVAVVALGAGVAFGLQTQGLKDDAAQLCPSSPCANADEANELSDRAGSRATLANVSFGAGAALVIGAAVLWFTGAPAEDSADAEDESVFIPRLGPGFAGAAYVGRF